MRVQLVMLATLLSWTARAASSPPAQPAAERTAAPAKAAPTPTALPAAPAPSAPAKAALVTADAKAPDADDSADADDSSDASGIEEKVSSSAKELEELQKAEDRALPDTTEGPGSVHRLGLANPLRLRAGDPFGREGALEDAGAGPALGDAGAVLAELGGIDLAALKKEYDIPIDVNDDVLEYIRFFQTSGRKWFAKWLERSHRWIAFERPILAEEGVPLDLVYLSMIESGFSAYAYSWARASGLWQFVPATGRLYGVRDDFWVDERRDPELATHAAAKYLKELHSEFGDWYLAWAAYNAGGGKLRQAIKRYGTRDFWQLAQAGRYLRPETKHYVPKLIAAALIAKHPARFGFLDPVTEGPFEYDEVEIPDATDLAVVAKAAGVSTEAVQRLNPALRRWCTPPARNGHGYVIKLPKGTKARFLAQFAKVKPSQRLTFRHHRVHRGDTLGAIARHFRMPVEPILRLNHIRNPRLLRLGEDLIIPLPTQLARNYPDMRDDWHQGRRSKHGRHHAGRGRRVAARRVHRGRRVSGHGHYVIHSGDTLWSIAQKFGVEVAELRRWNRLGWRGMHALRVGHSLVVAPPSRRKAERDFHRQDG